MRVRLIVSVVLLMISGAAGWVHHFGSPPAVRETSDVTDYGRTLAAAPERTDTATFAAGCFWKLEHAIRRVDGVVSTTSGYTGGWSGAADHATISTGRTGHVEAVRVVYDPARVSYERLLEVFWSSHDPARFGPSDDAVANEERRRPPGASIVFFHDNSQRIAAEASKARLAATAALKGPIPSEILPAAPFHRAEPEHQQYLDKHGRGSACRLN